MRNAGLAVEPVPGAGMPPGRAGMPTVEAVDAACRIRRETPVVNPQQEELRRNAKGATSQDSKGPNPVNRPSSRGDEGRPVPKGQVSPYGPAGEPVAEDDSDAR
ncbi:hypothetical protein [Micromonospora sp. NBC_01638]|uniref:hypothetical protein n=1 Tax=Micromonospora sp. NBC_01638 TaxID=2975982 RepID=UPI003869FE59|nr:hypothetical protein OG811_27035 [Micromonospora sp. NBC_01638]